MFKKYENKIFVFIFFYISCLVFLSRQIQINYIQKFQEKFYIFSDPIFINPDSYYFLTTIKNEIINSSLFFDKLIAKDLLTSIYIILFNLVENISLSELVMVSTPYFVLLAFVGMFLFFNSISNKKLALIVSFSFIVSEAFLSRSSVLSFDTDTLNIFFFFFILFLLNLFLQENLERKRFYIISFIFIIFNQIFYFHYPRSIFSFLFIFIILFIFLKIDQKKKDKLLLFSLILLSIIFNTSESFTFYNLFETQKIYNLAQIVQEESIISVSSSISELKKLSFFEIEKILFQYNFFYIFLVLSLIGLLFFLKKNIFNFIFLLPFFVFGYLTITHGFRFLMYFAPLIYFGFFYFFYFIFNIYKKKIKQKINYFNNIIVLIIITSIWKISLVSCVDLLSIDCKQKFNLKPYFEKEIVKGILKFNNFKKEYNIITSLDYGYLIDYYTNSVSVINPGAAFKGNKYKLFYSKEPLTNKYIKTQLNIKNDNKNYFFVTKDFIDWWPTISKLNTPKGNKISNILKFSCKEIFDSELKCISENGIKSLINLSKGQIDKDQLIFKIITNYRNSSTEELKNKNGKAILVYSPELKYNNLYVIFPKEFEKLNFIKYFFSIVKDSNLKIVDDGWPYYRTYEVN